MTAPTIIFLLNILYLIACYNWQLMEHLYMATPCSFPRLQHVYNIEITRAKESLTAIQVCEDLPKSVSKAAASALTCVNPLVYLQVF